MKCKYAFFELRRSAPPTPIIRAIIIPVDERAIVAIAPIRSSEKRSTTTVKSSLYMMKLAPPQLDN